MLRTADLIELQHLRASPPGAVLMEKMGFNGAPKYVTASEPKAVPSMFDVPTNRLLSGYASFARAM